MYLSVHLSLCPLSTSSHFLNACLDLEDELLDEIASFAKLIFRSSLGETQGLKDSGSSDDNMQIQFGDLAVDNTSVSIQLLLWAVTDENGKSFTSITNLPVDHYHCLYSLLSDAEKLLLSRISDRVNSNFNLKFILQQLPVITTCIEVCISVNTVGCLWVHVYTYACISYHMDAWPFIYHNAQLSYCTLQALGALSEKFPSMASTVVNTIREFLIHPSPILSRLSRHSESVNKQKSPAKQLQSANNSPAHADLLARSPNKVSIANKITDAFQTLLSVALKNLCTYVIMQTWKAESAIDHWLYPFQF